MSPVPPDDPGGVDGKHPGAAPGPKKRVLTCERVIAFLGEYASCTLPGLERAIIDRHLSACPVCATKAREYFEIIRLARGLPLPVPSAAAEARLRQVIAGAVRASRPADETKPETPLS